MIIEERKISKEPTIDPTAHIVDTQLGHYTEIGLCNFLENVEIADFSYTGQFVFIQNARIGKFVNIAAMVRIGPTTHPIKKPTLHHFAYRSKMYDFGDDDGAFFDHRLSRIATIGHDAWIGHGAIIMPEISIGNGAIVGAGAVVTKDVPPYAVVAGVPATIISYRFEPDIVERLQRICWWSWDTELIKARVLDFRGDIESFVRKYDRKDADHATAASD